MVQKKNKKYEAMMEHNNTSTIEELEKQKETCQKTINQTERNIKSIQDKMVDLKNTLNCNSIHAKTQLEEESKETSKRTWLYGLLTTLFVSSGLAFLPFYFVLAYTLLGTSVLPFIATLYYASHGYNVGQRIKNIVEASRCLAILEEAISNHQTILHKEQNKLKEIETSLSKLQKQIALQNEMDRLKQPSPYVSISTTPLDRFEELDIV